MDRDVYTIVDYFGPYPIDWELYDLVMGIKKTNIIDLKIKRPTNIYEILKEHKEKSKNNPGK